MSPVIYACGQNNGLIYFRLMVSTLNTVKNIYHNKKGKSPVFSEELYWSIKSIWK